VFEKNLIEIALLAGCAGEIQHNFEIISYV